MLPKHIDALPEGTACGGIAAFPKNERRRRQALPLLNHNLVGGIRRCVPVVREIPDGDQPNGIQENGIHGWCSL